MNNKRRKQIKDTIKEIVELRNEIKNQSIEDSDDLEMLIDSIEWIKSDIEEIQSDEQDAFDNLPEPFQDGERGEYMQECIDSLQYAYDEMDSIPTEIDEIELKDADKALESAVRHLEEIQ